MVDVVIQIIVELLQKRRVRGLEGTATRTLPRHIVSSLPQVVVMSVPVPAAFIILAVLDVDFAIVVLNVFLDNFLFLVAETRI